MHNILRRVLILFCLVLFLAGCSTVPVAPSQLKYKEDAVLDHGSAKMLEKQFVTEKSKTHDPVWSSLRNRKIDPVKQLTLAELIDFGLGNNPATHQAWENSRAARARQRQAESGFYPSVNVSETITREKNVSVNPASNLNDRHYGPSANLTWLILDFGGRNASVEEMIQGVISADSTYNQAIQDLLLNVEESYYQLYSAQALEEAARDDVKNAKADFDAATQRLNAGLVSKLDVLQAQSDYENSLYQLESAKGGIKTAQANLAQAIGVPADTHFQIARPSKNFPKSIDEEEITLIIEDTLQRRPDIVAARADVKAKEAAVKSAHSAMLPTLNVGASADSNKYNYYGTSQVNNKDHSYAAFASVNWDVFDGFYNLNKKIEADRQLNMAQDTLAQKELAVSADVWTKYYDFITAANKLVYSETFLTTAGESYRLALESYNAGLKSILDLLQAQSKLSDARSRFIQSNEDIFIALVELAHAKGSLSNVTGGHNGKNKK